MARWLDKPMSEGWDAFMHAHSNMNKIQLYMQQIPNYIKTALTIIAKGSTQLMELQLPPTLNRLSDIRRQCDVVEVTSLSQLIYIQRLRDVSSQVMKNEFGKIDADIDKEYADIKESLKKAQDIYQKAMDDIPTGWDLIGQRIVQGLSNVLMNGMMGMINSCTSGIKNGGMSGGKTGIDDGKPVPSFCKQKGINATRGLLDSLSLFTNTVRDILQGTNTENPLNIFKLFKISFNTTQSLEFTELFKPGKPKQEQTDGLMNTLMGAPSEVPHEAPHSLTYVPHPLTYGTSIEPYLISQSNNNHNNDIGSNEKFKAEMAKNQLEVQLKRPDAIFTQLMQQRKEVKELMVKIASLDLTKISYKEIIDILTQIISLLSGIHVQWAKLVEFFSEISIRPQIALNGTLGPFVDNAQ
ncbi:unnamed protein product [Didymodactylos carnosus]|uniref:Uncharacterized protein n=1 Tax=Didymodactylos carnosus TaxID=1234261 RepID=A0A8S2E498_9BILA|nr:unnamed protein product [Didymodactylos carnosus]CAF3829614.1 unnamed protein product [Didymodactylos carnosus]